MLSYWILNAFDIKDISPLFAYLSICSCTAISYTKVERLDTSQGNCHDLKHLLDWYRVLHLIHYKSKKL